MDGVWEKEWIVAQNDKGQCPFCDYRIDIYIERNCRMVNRLQREARYRGRAKCTKCGFCIITPITTETEMDFIGIVKNQLDVLEKNNTMKEKEEGYKPRCPSCGDENIERFLSWIKGVDGKKYRQKVGARCAKCGYKLEIGFEKDDEEAREELCEMLLFDQHILKGKQRNFDVTEINEKPMNWEEFQQTTGNAWLEIKGEIGKPIFLTETDVYESSKKIYCKESIHGVYGILKRVWLKFPLARERTKQTWTR